MRVFSGGDGEVVAEFTSDHFDILFVEHGLMTSGDFVNFQTASDYTIPALIKVEVTARRPIGGLEKDNAPRIWLWAIEV